MYGVALSATGNPVIQNQWSYALSNFSPDRIYLIGAEDHGMRAYNPFKEAQLVQTAEEIEEHTVLISPYNARYVPGVQNLNNFKHPKICTYIFGPDNHHLSEVELGTLNPDFSVYIDTDTKDEMYSFMAYAVTVFHRSLQHG